MPRKDTANTVLGMLSSTGAQTRPADHEPEAPAAAATPQPEPQPIVAQPDPVPAPTVRTLPPAPAADTKAAAPRTMRLRADTAAQLRAAWLEAKRNGDDVLLSAQDFASDLIEDALRRQRRRRTADAS